MNWNPIVLLVKKNILYQTHVMHSNMQYKHPTSFKPTKAVVFAEWTSTYLTFLSASSGTKGLNGASKANSVLGGWVVINTPKMDQSR